ncbi:hypothetical protein LX32DRAFT_405796 [Colletotrichum zoysiae]|uniref:Secreted protein n=1 Tax=Colletotrichum zoysiae TaxID=1216348 RepID=A0AAD9HH59_9PEZI|nr:hypothetical protein LX32DRAFT_405796 [Colletotrichum zoysiae]
MITRPVFCPQPFSLLLPMAWYLGSQALQNVATEKLRPLPKYSAKGGGSKLLWMILCASVVSGKNRRGADRVPKKTMTYRNRR